MHAGGFLLGYIAPRLLGYPQVRGACASDSRQRKGKVDMQRQIEIALLLPYVPKQTRKQGSQCVSEVTQVKQSQIYAYTDIYMVV